MSKEADEAYERVKQRALEEGIPHEDDCKWKGSDVPHDVAPCRCSEKWWFRQAVEAGAELAAKEELERMGYATQYLNEGTFRELLKQAQELEEEARKS